MIHEWLEEGAIGLNLRGVSTTGFFGSELGAVVSGKPSNEDVPAEIEGAVITAVVYGQGREEKSFTGLEER